MITHEIKITKLEIDNSNPSLPNKVKSIFYECKGTDSETGRSYTQRAICLAPDKTSVLFVPFEELTEEKVLQWVTESNSYNNVKNNVNRIIERLSEPPTIIVDNLPWV